MKNFIKPRSEIILETNSDAAAGLSAEQIENNREQYGSNVLTKEKPTPLWKRVIDAASEPMILMLIFAGLIALSVNVIRGVTGGETDYIECIGIFVAIFLSIIITVAMEGKSAKAFEALAKMNDDTTIKVIRGGNAAMLLQKELVVGDIIMLAAGDKLPADGRLLESKKRCGSRIHGRKHTACRTQQHGLFRKLYYKRLRQNDCYGCR